MLQWVQESWIAVIIGFLFIGILLDAVVASREAIAGFIKRLRNRQGSGRDTKGR
jgi:hypothetical protein